MSMLFTLFYSIHSRFCIEISVNEEDFLFSHFFHFQVILNKYEATESKYGLSFKIPFLVWM